MLRLNSVAALQGFCICFRHEDKNILFGGTHTGFYGDASCLLTSITPGFSDWLVKAYDVFKPGDLRAMKNFPQSL